MDTKDIKAMHEVEENIVDDPHLPRGKALKMLQRAHQQRGWLLDEVERLQQLVINERYAGRLEAENAERLQEQLDDLASAQRERQWME